MDKLLSYLKLLRPAQWLKNLMLFFPPLLGGVFFRDGVVRSGIIPLMVFCLAASASYVFNDIRDRERDAHHPQKRFRPLPSGKIPVGHAYLTYVVLLLSSLCIGYQFSTKFFLLLIAYILVATAYSLKLKDIPIIDLFCISIGFLLRLQAGGEVFGIVISEWLFLSVFLLALFLSTGKRLGEKRSLGEKAGTHRKSLESYPDGFLDGTLYMSGAAVLVTYTMYVISRHALVYTVILCCFGLLRFIFRISLGFSGDPTESLVRDMPLFVVALLWVLMVCYIIYR